jgi:chromosomal replication initiator protein
MPEADEAARVNPRPTIADIQAAVCAHYQLRLADMTTHRRAKAITHPRQVAMFLSCELTPRTLPEIGQRFGGRDHSTVIHARTVVPQRMAEDDELAQAVAAIRAAVMTCAIERAEAIQRQLAGQEARLD